MEDQILFLTSTVLVAGCLIMGLIFLILPLPSAERLKNYRISLKVLSSAYFIQGTLATLPFILDTEGVCLISPIDLIICSSQVILFSLTLITLFNPTFVTIRVISRFSSPLFLFIVLLFIFSAIWGNPDLKTLAELKQNSTHPTVILREFFLFFYVFQIAYFSRIFFLQERHYKQQLNDYFADNYRLHLKWVRYCFFAALIVGLIAFTSFFFFSITWVMATCFIYAVFYVGFGLFFIQYPQTFIQIEKAIEHEPVINPDVLKTDNRQYHWKDIREQIIEQKYYLKSGVNIEELAQQLQVGRTTLSGFINTEEGVNFNLWINKLRIDEAKQLLVQEPDYSIAQVSEMVGFSEQSNFSRQFKLITNESPSVWRQQNQTTY